MVDPCSFSSTWASSSMLECALTLPLDCNFWLLTSANFSQKTNCLGLHGTPMPSPLQSWSSMGFPFHMNFKVLKGDPCQSYSLHFIALIYAWEMFCCSFLLLIFKMRCGGEDYFLLSSCDTHQPLKELHTTREKVNITKARTLFLKRERLCLLLFCTLFL